MTGGDIWEPRVTFSWVQRESQLRVGSGGGVGGKGGRKASYSCQLASISQLHPGPGLKTRLREAGMKVGICRAHRCTSWLPPGPATLSMAQAFPD